MNQTNTTLRLFSRFLFCCVFFLIFMGALVTSHDAGLSVPDWPTTYGENMFLFPVHKWTGTIFYEHVHRLVASVIGVLTVILAVLTWRKEPRRWMRNLTYAAVVMVTIQGLLGGLTVRMQLPLAVSVAHGMLAQTFFLVVLTIAYGHRRRAVQTPPVVLPENVRRWGLFTFVAVYVQLFLGAVMRHSESGLAVPDFPTVGGLLLPNHGTLAVVNEMRRGLHLPPADWLQVGIHLLHRGWAIMVLTAIITLWFAAWRAAPHLKKATNVLLYMGISQLFLGIETVLSGRQPFITSAHVVLGAAVLAMSFYLTLRTGVWRQLERSKINEQHPYGLQAS